MREKLSGQPESLARKLQLSDWENVVDSAVDHGHSAILRHQSIRRTLWQIVLVATAIGVAGNIVADFLLRALSEYVLLAPAALVLLVILMLQFERQYKPRKPVEVFARFDSTTLSCHFSTESLENLYYLLERSGVTDFGEFAAKIIGALGHFLPPITFQDPLPEPIVEQDDRENFKATTGRFDLSHFAQKNGYQGLRCEMAVHLYSAEWSPFYGLREIKEERVTDLAGYVAFRIMNPEHRRADEFVEEVVRPLFGEVLERLAQELFQMLSMEYFRIDAIRQFQRRFSEHEVGRKHVKPMFLSDHIPYDGKSRCLVVVESGKQVDAERLFMVLTEAGLLGSYVTDSDDWPPAKLTKRGGPLFGMSSHIVRELIQIRPRIVVAFGKVAASYVRSHWGFLKEKPVLVELPRLDSFRSEEAIVEALGRVPK